MNDKIDLLDHGFIRLVDHMGDDLSIVRNARVSYDAEWRAGEDEGSDTKLINFLHRNGHNTPFESVELQFEVKAPIFVFRQWHRHRVWSYNELSARYRELSEEFYIPEPHLVGKQNSDNKQMRDTLTQDEYDDLDQHDKDVIEDALDLMRGVNEDAFVVYRGLLKDGFPRELARSILPFGTYSHMFAKVNLGNLFKFIKERSHSNAQYEIRVYSDAMLKLIEPIVPVAVAAFKKQLNSGE